MLLPITGTANINTDPVNGVDTEVVKVGFGVLGTVPTLVSSATPLPVHDAGPAPPSFLRLQAAATTNAASIKNTPTVLKSICLTNNTTSNRYLKLYDKASAPTVGTDAPKFVLCLSGGAAFAPDETPEGGIQFTLGLAIAMTAGTGADSDTTPCSANDLMGYLTYV